MSMRDLGLENKGKQQPPRNSKLVSKTKEETKQVRISKEAYHILKKQAFLTETTMKDYLDTLIMQDGE